MESVKIHPAHCAHGRKPNESQSAPEIKIVEIKQLLWGKKTPRLQKISEGWELGL